jgi:hypothetical protein
MISGGDTIARLFLFAVFVASLPAAAQAQVDARDVAVARREFQAGLQPARNGEWESARDHFARSYEINPRISALFNLAGAQAQTGDLVEAAESYREYLGRRSEASASNVAEAERLLADLEARTPTLELRIDDLRGEDEVLLDGSALNRLLLGQPMPLSPGEHRVSVVRGGAEIASETLAAAEGARLAVTLAAPPLEPIAEPDVPELDPPPPAIPAPAPTPATDLSPSAAATTLPPEDTSGSVIERWWFWTIVGVVIVGAVVIGVVFATRGGTPPDSRGFQMTAPVEVP